MHQVAMPDDGSRYVLLMLLLLLLLLLLLPPPPPSPPDPSSQSPSPFRHARLRSINNGGGLSCHMGKGQGPIAVMSGGAMLDR